MNDELTTLDDVVAALRSLHRWRESNEIHPLTGGVSALVALVEGDDEEWIVKVPLGQLTVSDEWLASRERGANEAEVLRLLDGRLGPVRTPRLLFFDPTFVLMGVEYVRPPALNYKEELLAGRVHADAARRVGEALGVLHGLVAPDSLAGPGPRQLFDELRLDPYYRMTAQRRPELRESLMALVEETAATRLSLVHGDLSPKNILVTESEPVLLDWEVIHVGDPAFDRGMMAAHLLLKICYHGVRDAAHPLVGALAGFWDAYRGPAPEEHSLAHLGGVALARLYGKSPVDYLRDEAARERAHRLAVEALTGAARTMASLIEAVTSE